MGNGHKALSLVYERRHVFADIDGRRWLVDTGSDRCVSDQPSLTFEGRQYPAFPEYGGLTVQRLNEFVGVRHDGLLGNAVLNQFDWDIRLALQQAEYSDRYLAVPGTVVPFRDWHTLPLVEAEVDGHRGTWVFDTGAPVCYWQDPARRQTYPDAGPYRDFFPGGVGWFDTHTNVVPFTVGGLTIPVRTGTLPKHVEPFVKAVGAEGIIGNEVFVNRRVGWFPRRHQLVLGDRDDVL